MTSSPENARDPVDVPVVHLVGEQRDVDTLGDEETVVVTTVEEVRRRLRARPAAPVVVHHDPPAVDAPTAVRDLLDARPGSTVVAVVPDADAARQARSAGATEVYRVRDRPPDPDLLGERVWTARAVADRAGDPDRPDREKRLEQLIRTTRRLMAAGTTDEVLEVTSEVAADVLDFPGTGVRRYDPGSESLVNVAIGSTVTDIEDRPTYPVADTPHGRAFERGEVVVEDIEGEDPYDREPFVQTMYVPIGRWGVLSAGRTDRPFDPTDRRLAELLATTAEAALNRAARQEALVQYREVLEATAGMVYALDEDGRFTLMTDAVADRLGYDREALLGEHASVIVDEGDAARARETIAGLLSSGRESTEVEGRLVTASGDPFPVSVEISVLRDEDGEFAGSVGLVRDITELQETRERLRKQRDRFSYLFDNLPDAVVEVEYVEEQPIVRSVNPTFEDIFGYGAGEVVGESLDEFVLPPEDEAEGERLNRVAAAGETIETEVRRGTADGDRHFLLRVFPYEQAGGSTRSFAIYTDITDQKQREQSLNVINRVLRHNLRNELNVVAGKAEDLAGAVDDPDLRATATEIGETARRLAGFSEKGREIQAAVRSGLDDDDEVDLAPILRSIAGRYEDRFPDATVAADAPASAVVDAGEQIATAVENLVENAIVHNPADPRVVVAVERDDTWTTVRIADDGPGIPEAERAVIEADREITQLEHASGLGLWLVKWICEGYGGRITFEESDLGGTAVVVRLPTAD